MDNKDFYPTPAPLIEKMLTGINLSTAQPILEPSAGKGDIADYITNKDERHSTYKTPIDTIEIDPNLQHILRSKGYPVIHDDFLTFTTGKHYRLIVANFPFSDGDSHLKKALSLLEQHGGQLVCLVNAETLRNPYTNLRKALVTKLESYDATIEYLTEQFTAAERKTNVEVALIRVTVPQANPHSILFDNLEQAEQIRASKQEQTQIVGGDFIKALVARFNTEVKLGSSLIHEYIALRPLMLARMPKKDEQDPYNDSILNLTVGRDRYGSGDLVNDYLRELRYKYWAVLIGDSRFTSRYTSNITKSLREKLDKLKDYDFTEFNIAQLRQELNANLVLGIEEAILKMFDELSGKYAYHEEFGTNIHYYNGWKHNKAHKINSKVILPMNGFSAYSFSSKGKLDNSYIHERLQDMVKALNYLAAELDNADDVVGRAVNRANQIGTFRRINFHYFEATFYKKGTCHITFTDLKLLAKFNIFGARKRNWLPPSYGRKRYAEMDKEEQTVIDNFQGREAYEEVVSDSKYYIVESSQLLLEG